MLRSVFMGTPEFSVPSLVALHSFTQVMGVYSQPDRRVGRGQKLQPPPVKKKALELGLPVFQPLKLNTAEELERIEKLQPDVVLVVAYGRLLKAKWLEIPRLGCINVHASLLPRWRGASPIQWALWQGDSETGVTTMLMAEGLDTGDILLQEKTEINTMDTSQTLHDRLSVMGAELIEPTLRAWSSGEIQSQKQDDSQATYASKLSKDDQWLDWRQSAAALDRQIRALNSWPGASVMTVNGTRLRILSALPSSERGQAPGEVFESAGRLFLGTAEGALELKKVQWEGKGPVDAKAFLNAIRGQKQSLPFQLKVCGGKLG